MATFKAEVNKHQVRKDGTYTIKIRILHKRKKRYLSTNLVVTKNDLTKSFKLKNYFFIDETEKIIKNYRDICNRNALLLKSIDVNQVYDLITKTDEMSDFFIDIVSYAKKYIKTLKTSGKEGTARNYQLAINNLIKFTGTDKIDINRINAKFIKDWVDWIDGERAKSLYPSGIRKLHNDAKREYNVEELGIIKIPLSPFSVVRLPKIPKAKIPHIPVEKIREIFTIPDIEIYQKGTNRQNFARDLFILSFCLCGTNAKDLYELKEYKNGRITYNRAKTMSRRDDNAFISIKVEPEIEYLFEKYKDKTGKRVFNFYQKYSSIDCFSNAITYGIKQIRKIIDIDYLIFYSARHSFATIARNKIKIDKYTVHQMLNHVDSEMKITDIYIEKDWTLFDEANRKLLDYVFEK